MGEAAPSRPGLSVTGTDHHIDIAPDVDLSAGVEISGHGHTLVIAPGVSLATQAVARPPALRIAGDGAEVRLGARSRLAVQMAVEGAGARLLIGEDVVANGWFSLPGADTLLAVGDATSMVQAAIQLHEPGHIRIGRDCMISSQVYISLSDIHPIYDRATGARINPAASVEIGDHVWLGLRSMVMKGSRIGDGAVVAAGALVSGEVDPDCVVGGAPARVMRRGVVWRRDFDEPPPEPQSGSEPQSAPEVRAPGGRLARLWPWSRR